MSKLSHADLAFVERRRARAGIGLFGLPLGLLLAVGAWGALYVWSPETINPLRAGDLYVGRNEEAVSHARHAAIYLNLMFAFLTSTIVSGIAFAFVERRYRKLIDRLAAASAVAASPESAPAAARSGV